MDRNTSTERRNYEKPSVKVLGSLHLLTRETGKAYGETDGFYMVENGATLHSVS
jgi:hypothetical protein